VERGISLPPINYDVDGQYIGLEPTAEDAKHLPFAGLSQGGGGHMDKIHSGRSEPSHSNRDAPSHSSGHMDLPPVEAHHLLAVRLGTRMAVMNDEGATPAVVAAAIHEEMGHAHVNPDAYLEGGAELNNYFGEIAAHAGDDGASVLTHVLRQRARDEDTASQATGRQTLEAGGEDAARVRRERHRVHYTAEDHIRRRSERIYREGEVRRLAYGDTAGWDRIAETARQGRGRQRTRGATRREGERRARAYSAGRTQREVVRVGNQTRFRGGRASAAEARFHSDRGDVTTGEGGGGTPRRREKRD